MRCIKTFVPNIRIVLVFLILIFMILVPLLSCRSRPADSGKMHPQPLHSADSGKLHQPLHAGWFGLYFTIDNPKIQLTSIYFCDNNNGFATESNGNILKTTDGGIHWVDISPEKSIIGDWMPQSIQFPVDAQTGYVVGEGYNISDPGGILKTTDSGAHWQYQPVKRGEQDSEGKWKYQVVPYQRLQYVHFPLNTKTGYAVGKDLIFKTTDGGANWLMIGPSSSLGFNSVCFPTNEQTGYVVGNKGLFWKTKDGFNNVENQISGTNNDLRSVDFPLNSQTGYVVGFGTILKTTDGGDSWVNQWTNDQPSFYSVNFPKGDQTGYVVGTNSTILKTTNGGAQWVVQDWYSHPVGLPKEFTDNTNISEIFTGLSVTFPVDPQTGYVLMYSGGQEMILKTTTGGEPGQR